MVTRHYICLCTPYTAKELELAKKRAEELTEETGFQFIVLTVKEETK